MSDEAIRRQVRTLAEQTCPLCGGRIYTGTIRDAWSEGGTLREVRQCAGCGMVVADVPACEQGSLDV